MNDNPSQTPDAPQQNTAEAEESGVTFSMDDNDPRRVDNRGGLDAVFPNEGTATAVTGGGQGNSDADTSRPSSGASNDTGATVRGQQQPT